MSDITGSYRLRRAADVLNSGGVICHPTEAVWGLACRPDAPLAVARIWALKARDPAKGVLLISDCVDRIAPLLDGLPAVRRDEILASWPGPVTWVFPDDGWAPAWIRGRHRSVAVRVTDHTLAAALCRAADSCLVSTSANPAGKAPARTQLAAQRYFGNELDAYLLGRCGDLANPTTIRDALSGRIIRDA